jgi:signal peptidase I
MAEEQPKPKKSSARGLIELGLTLVVAVGIAFAVQTFLVKPYRIPSGSMIPTLQVGQRVLVDRVGTHLSPPDIGDIIVFYPPVGADEQRCGVQPRPGQPCATPEPQRSPQAFIKRVVAGPGDRIAIVHGHVVRNGVLQKEPFIRPCASEEMTCEMPVAITVSPDHYFMMGDNRGQSDDSRFWGPVPRQWVIGEAFFIYWPPGRSGTI